MSVVTLATLSQYIVLIVEFYVVTVLRGVGEGLSQASFMFCLIYKLSSNLDKHSQLDVATIVGFFVYSYL